MRKCIFVETLAQHVAQHGINLTNRPQEIFVRAMLHYTQKLDVEIKIYFNQKTF